MAKKLLIPLCLLLALVFSVQSAATATEPKMFKEDTVTFSQYTEGADAAFDGDKETGYGGSITGVLAHRTVITGVTVRANAQIVDLTVKGSENGVDWVDMYYQKKVTSIAIFGSNGSGSISDAMCEDMYTYSFKYIRFEMKYGSISEISMYGYATDVEGYIAELDTSFGNGGYESTGSYYTDYERMPFVIDHKIHSATKGEVITYQFTNEAQSEKLAYLTLKAKGDAPITEIALMHKDDKNAARWDGIKVEVSADNQNWVEVMTIPSDFSSRHNLRLRTIMLVDVPENSSYVYARISSTRSSMSICVMDLYTKADGAQAPSNVLKGWENDPFIKVEAPIETEEVTEPVETAADADTDTAESDTPDSKKGCGSTVMLAAFPVATLCSSVALITNKRKNKTKQK